MKGKYLFDRQIKLSTSNDCINSKFFLIYKVGQRQIGKVQKRKQKIIIKKKKKRKGRQKRKERERERREKQELESHGLVFLLLGPPFPSYFLFHHLPLLHPSLVSSSSLSSLPPFSLMAEDKVF